MTEIILEYTIPDKMKVSTNKIYSWMHWRKRQLLADYYHSIVIADCRNLQPISEKVDIYFLFEWKWRTLDSSNCTFIAKMIEDALRKSKLIVDDSIRYVWRFSCESTKWKENKVIITITNYEH